MPTDPDIHVYVSGSLHDIPNVRNVQAAFRRMGHTITYDWTDVDAITPSREEAERQMSEGVYDADLVVLLDHERGKGKYIEAGFALAHDVPLLVVPHARSTPSLFWKLEGCRVMEPKPPFTPGAVVGEAEEFMRSPR